MGHLSRCIQLAHRLKNHSIKSYFLIKKNNIAIELIKTAGFQYSTMSTIYNEKQELSTIQKLHKKIGFNCIFIDLRKTQSKTFFRTIKKISKSIVIDNVDNNSLLADLVIWPWSDLKERRTKFSPTLSHKLLTGSNYMLLGKYYRKKPIKEYSNSILISMGGSDKGGYTTKIINSFKKGKKKFHAKIVLGRFFKDSVKISKSVEGDKRFSIIKNNDNLIPLMQNSKIGIFSFGITTYEALFTGLPSIIFSHSIQNDTYGKLLSNQNCINYLGYYKKVDFTKIPTIAFELLNNKQLRKKYSKRGQSLVDGKGIIRVTKKIIEITNA